MQTALTIGFYIALAGILIALGIGIANLARTDENAASRSNKLMRMRVMFQAVAIGLLVLLGIVGGAIKFGG